jgi:hypothetical protein
VDVLDDKRSIVVLRIRMKERREVQKFPHAGGASMASLISKVRHRALNFLSHRGPKIADICVERAVLCPQEDQETPPGIYDPRDFERITTFERTTSSMERELARMRGGVRHHGATILYELKDARLWDGWVSSRGWRKRNALRPAAWRDGAPAELDRAVFGSTFVGSLYFGHWLLDDLPLLLEASSHGVPVVTTARSPYGHQSGYLEMTGLQSQALIRADFRRLTWIDNVAQNSYRAAQYRALRRRIRKTTSPIEGRRVMLHRGDSGARRVLVNEHEIEEMLARRGFEIVDPLKSSAEEVVRACAGARIALGVEGSQLSHAFLSMADRSAIVALIPPYRYINHYKDVTDCMGTMRYGSITGTEVAGGFRIEPGELLRLLERVEKALGHRG